MKKIFLILTFILSVFSFLKADDIIVTSAEDSGDGSLRKAISDAQSGSVIKFNLDADKITLASVINVNDVRTLIIDGMNEATNKPIILTSTANRVFGVGTSGAPTGVNVTFRNLVVEEVTATANGAAFSSGNSSYDGSAGKLLDPEAITVTLENCYIKDCTVTLSSTATSGGGAGYFVSHGTNLIIKNSTFEGNNVTKTSGYTNNAYGGGAIGSTGNNTAKITIVNSTFINNTSNGRGGSIHTGHSLTLINSTIVGSAAARGAGVYLNNSNTHYFVNSIIANNSETSDTPGNSEKNKIDLDAGGTVNMSNCLIGKTNTTLDENSIAYAENMDVFADGLLADNGGVTPTIALSATSVALNKGTATSNDLNIPVTDQRGYPRLDPPSIGAYDNPEYKEPKDPTQWVSPEKQSFDAIATGKQIAVSCTDAGYVVVYGLTGNVVASDYVEGSITLPAILNSSIYLVRFTGTNGNTSVMKILIK